MLLCSGNRLPATWMIGRSMMSTSMPACRSHQHRLRNFTRVDGVTTGFWVPRPSLRREPGYEVRAAALTTVLGAVSASLGALRFRKLDHIANDSRRPSSQPDRPVRTRRRRGAARHIAAREKEPKLCARLSAPILTRGRLCSGLPAMNPDRASADFPAVEYEVNAWPAPARDQ